MGLEKEETKPKISSRKRIMKTRIEIYDIENSKNVHRTQDGRKTDYGERELGHEILASRVIAVK